MVPRLYDSRARKPLLDHFRRRAPAEVGRRRVRVVRVGIRAVDQDLAVDLAELRVDAFDFPPGDGEEECVRLGDRLGVGAVPGSADLLRLCLRPLRISRADDYLVSRLHELAAEPGGHVPSADCRDLHGCRPRIRFTRSWMCSLGPAMLLSIA